MMVSQTPCQYTASQWARSSTNRTVDTFSVVAVKHSTVSPLIAK